MCLLTNGAFVTVRVALQDHCQGDLLHKYRICWFIIVSAREMTQHVLHTLA